MSSAPGDRLGPYEITAQIGEGGMGLVFKARDFHLGREVALKVLPEGFTQDAERVARFEREAKLLASLNHPNIAQIYGLEQGDGTKALVMELVEGPTLADRLASGALPLDECLSIARQIAEALEEAHERGIVHRDLKPQNIKASLEGKVKVLDFGLAKAIDPTASAPGLPGAGGAGPPLSNSPTLMNSPTLTGLGATQLGVILGTAAYMAPEQARGGTVDKRADIWAFGVVLWEMLVGRRLFEGETVSDTLAAVLRAEVDLAPLPAQVPPAVRQLVGRCLQRDPRRRLRDIGDARIVLDEAARGEPAVVPAPSGALARPQNRVAAILIATALAAIAGGALGWLAARSAAAPAQPAGLPSGQFRELTREPGGERYPSLAPDGESFVFVKRHDGQQDVFLQRVGGRNAINLTADCAEDDFDPAFSPDGRWIAYHSRCGGGGLFVMGATGESARKVSELGFTPSWSPDGREIAVADVRTDAPWAIAGTSSIWAVRLDSGERRVVSRALGLSPSWSPDGRRIAFWDLSVKGYQRDLWTVAADGSQADPAQAVPVTDDAPLDWNPVWTPAGDALVFGSTRSGAFNLWRIALDPATGAPRGAPAPLTVPSGWAGWPSLSRDGRRLAFVDRNARSTVVRVPFDPVARKLAGAAAPAFQSSLELLEQELSPDGTWILFSNAGLPANLHVVRADGTGYRQVIDGDFRDRQAHWSPDGRTIAFQTSRWDSGLALVHADGSGLRQIPSGPEPIWEPRWSPDGTRLAVNSNDHFLIVDLRTTPPTPHEQPLPGEDQTFLPCSWSRDGETILGSVLHRGELVHYGTFSPRDGSYRRIDLRAPAGGGLRFGGDFQSHYPTLLPDGRSFLFADGEQLLLGDLAGGPVQEIYRAAPQHRLERPTLSHDGRWLTVLDLADESDIWLATFEPTNEPDRAEEKP